MDLNNKLDNLLEELVSSSVANRSFKIAKKEAIDAVIVSRLRHMADRDVKTNKNVEIKLKFKKLRNELAKEKVNHLNALVTAANTTNDRVSVAINDDKGSTRSITADFDNKDHMSLHIIKGSSKLLDTDREGRMQSTGFGENDIFIKNMTGKDLPELLDAKYKDMKHKYGINEGYFMENDIDLEMLAEDILMLDEGRRLKYFDYVHTHINNVRKGYRWMKKNIPEIFVGKGQKIRTDMTIMRHDLSKYGKSEFSPYSKHFMGNDKEKEQSQEDFTKAWNHHQKLNKHHWQYWVLVDKDGNNKVLDMPFENIVEMIADWWSFSWKSGKLDEIFSWYAANKSKMILSPKTQASVEMILNKMKTKLIKLENDKKLDESLEAMQDLEAMYADPFEDEEEDFYDGIPMDEETYLFCKDCENRLLNERLYITKEQREYAEYLTQHITNVKRGYFWIKENAPEILENCDLKKVEENLIIHDESKYSPEEYDAYSKFFYGERTMKVKRDFKAACMHHFMNNQHHPEWWMGLDMSQEALVEALCDWWSFSWKDNNMNDIFDFWEKARNSHSKSMSDDTKVRMQVLMDKLHHALSIMDLI